MTEACVTVGVALRAHRGETLAGDAYVALARPHGFLLGVADGLGHGKEAAAAASAGLEGLGSCSAATLASSITASHRRLRGTRGAAISVAFLDARSDLLSWLGVGNVEGVLFRADARDRLPMESMVLSRGVVGLHVPEMTARTVPIRRGDVLVLTTDGVRLGFHVDVTEDPQRAAESILARHDKSTDDALVLVARYLGGQR